MAQQVKFYDDLRLMAKRTNQRMVELEKRDMITPAYQAVQAKLEMMGRRSGEGRGRRFSETGKYTYAESQTIRQVLEEFLEAKTSTVRGAKMARDKAYETADSRYNLKEYGISKSDYFSFMAEWAEHNKDKLLSSEQAIEIYQAYEYKEGKANAENKLTSEEIADIIKSSKNVKQAYNKIGITYQDVKKARNLNEMQTLKEAGYL